MPCHSASVRERDLTSPDPSLLREATINTATDSAKPQQYHSECFIQTLKHTAFIPINKIITLATTE